MTAASDTSATMTATRFERRLLGRPRTGKTRTETWAALGLLKVVDPATRHAFSIAEDRIWREGLRNNPHGHPWHTSQHASSFPGDDPRACGRKAIYTLMDIPKNEPANRRLVGQGEVGKAIELMLQDKFGMAEMLLSDNENDADVDFQTGFIDEDNWLTGNMDLLIVPVGWDRPHVVEVKSKAHDVVLQMKRGERGPDPAHINQCKTYIGFANERADRWPEYKPVQDGSIFYCSRDDPSFTHEFFYSYDPAFMEQGRDRLAEWNDYFVRGELPPHPFGGKEWSQLPCKWCPFKKFACKPDHKAGVTKLRDSNGIEWAREIRPNYDYDKKRKAVLTRWGADDMEDA